MPGGAYLDPVTADERFQGLKEFDACEDLLICLANDPGLLQVLLRLNGRGREEIKGWRRGGDKKMLRWRFLNELPREGKPGREPIVLGFWGERNEVRVAEALAK